MTPINYGLFFVKVLYSWYQIEATKFDENYKPIAWAIRFGSEVMSNSSGEFEYETLPSSRDTKFFEEFRFETAEAAFNFWELHKQKHISKWN